MPTTAPATPSPAAPTDPADSASFAGHERSIDQTLRHLNVTPDGLTDADAAARLAEHGPNVLPRAQTDGPLQILWRQINSPLIWVLIGSGAVAMAADFHGEGVKNGLVILAVVVLNTVIGAVQEFKAGKAIEALAQMVPQQVSVRRGGAVRSVPAADLVPGDVVLLASGDKVPADLRLLEVKNLQAQEAALTGESVPVPKSLAPVAADAALGDRTCMAFAGTLVTYGAGAGVVTATAHRTELGRISALLRDTTDLDTPLTHALRSIGKAITLGIVVVTLLMLAVGVARMMAATDATLLTAVRQTLIFGIALAVGAIPEGLPAIVTIALAIGVQRMAARRAVVRKLPAVETLGSTTVICSDKTGTLTRNEMTVQALWLPQGDAAGDFTLTGVGYEPRGTLRRDDRDLPDVPRAVHDLLLAAALCSDATLRHEDGRHQITGDPTEGALVVAAAKLGIDAAERRRQLQRLDVIPFESDRQYMATLHDLPGRGRVALLKGAPEVLQRRCADPCAGLAEAAERLARRGVRVLAVAQKPLPDHRELHPEDVDGGLTLLGLVGMIDPPRTEVIASIRACHDAGITVKMITGDHHATAAAIAQELGILQGRAPVTGHTLATTPDEQLPQLAESSNVFARVAPEHKLKLVRALQQRGHVVAMTGDGVNDAPALKQANIGVAMGITGTSVSKESAAIVLTDDNFASIAAAVEEGRRVYDNLIKSLAFVLPTNLGLALILLAAVAFFPFDPASGQLLLPMAPVQLLWINLVATVALALPLAFEAKEPDVMRRPPRDPRAPVLSRFVLVRTALVAALMAAGAVGLFYWEYTRDLARGLARTEALADAQTTAVTTVILFQVFYLLNCRSLRDSLLAIGLWSNRMVYAGIAALLALQLAFVYLPPLQAVFGTAAMPVQAWLTAAAVAALILPVIGVEKWVRARRRAAG